MDFETTAPEQNKMFVVSYTLMFAFYPKLSFNRVVMRRSFGHSLIELGTADYLTED